MRRHSRTAARAIAASRNGSIWLLTAFVILVLLSVAASAQTDPLPSWNDRSVKGSITDFVASVTEKGGSNFVPVEDRIAVFDMDGTLIPEQPMPVAVIPLAEDIRAAVKADPSVAKKPAIAALLAHDEAGVIAAGEEGVADIVGVATGGRTVEEAADHFRKVMAGFTHPKFKRPITGLVYQPMSELISYLRANGFEVWICSGSPVLFTRQFSEEMVGVPPERVMGTALKTEFTERDGKSVLVFKDEIDHINDKEGKPPTINSAIGKRPLFVGGNVRSHGDIAMMRYSKDRDGPSFQLLINHDDADREYAYEEKDNASLQDAAKYGFHVVSMKEDWNQVLSGEGLVGEALRGGVPFDERFSAGQGK